MGRLRFAQIGPAERSYALISEALKLTAIKIASSFGLTALYLACLWSIWWR